MAQRISQGYEAVAAEHPELNIVADQFHEAWSPDKALKTVEMRSLQTTMIFRRLSRPQTRSLWASFLRSKQRSWTAKRSSAGWMEISAAKLINEGVMTMSIWTDIVSGDQRTIEAAVKLGKG